MAHMFFDFYKLLYLYCICVTGISTHIIIVPVFQWPIFKEGSLGPEPPPLHHKHHCKEDNNHEYTCVLKFSHNKRQALVNYYYLIVIHTFLRQKKNNKITTMELYAETILYQTILFMCIFLVTTSEQYKIITL
jgi:hypothetical protein